VDDPARPVEGAPLGAGVEVPDRADSIPAARAFLTRILDGWGVADEVIADASLLTSELMANAVKHGVGIVNLKIEVSDGLLHVAVHDEGPDAPIVRDAGESDPSGRGMWIVQSIARDWGSDADRSEPGKTVWFDLVTVRSPAGNRNERRPHRD
jgi:anti-sigma regulatory factor (Ser/Thr protein kinase)